MLDDTIPVKPCGVKSRTHMDIDFSGFHPSLKPVKIEFANFLLKPRIIVEVKGWIDYSGGETLRYLKYDLDLIKAKKFIPKTCSRKKDGLTYTFLKEEIYNKACKIFKTDDFDRLMIVPSMPLNCKTEGKLVTKDWVKDEYKKKDVFVVELNDVVSDLIKYAKENSQDKDSPNAMNRRNFVLELIHTLERQTFCESKTIF